MFVLAVLSGAAGAPHPADAFVPSVPDAPRPSAGSRIRELPLGHIPPPSGPGAAGPQVPPVPPPLGAPGLSASFEGLDFDAEAALSGFYHIPPDPIGAAGPDHVVSVVNSAIQWQSKTGTGAVGKPLGHDGTTAVGSFFESLSPVTRVFDPKVVYDQHAGRFVVVCLEWTSTTSRILVAVSSGGDPGGSWRFQAIDSSVQIGGSAHWADYPGLAVDEEAIYVAANMFRFSDDAFGGVRLWILDKGLYGPGGSSTVTAHDPYAAGGTAVTTQPAHVFGTPDSSAFGTFLVSYWGTMSVGGVERVQVVRVDDPLGAPTFTREYVSVGDIDNTAVVTLPGAPQPGSARLIDVNDRRALNAVWRAGALWMTAEILPASGPDAGQTTAHWWKLNATVPAPPAPVPAITLADQGNVGGEDIAAGTYTFYPSLAVDRHGNMGVGFAASAPTVNPGAYYTGRLSSDPAGTTQPAGVLAAGVDSYYRAFGGGDNRWGDYSGISLDPVDELTFWAFNQYALLRGTVFPPYPTQDGRWGTRWGAFDIQSTPVDLIAFGAVSSAGRVTLSWRTGSEADCAGFLLWRAEAAEGEYTAVSEAPIPAEGGLAAGAEYAFADTSVITGRSYWYRLEEVSTLGGSTFHGPVSAVAGSLDLIRPRRRAIVGSAHPPRFLWRSAPYDRFRVEFCAGTGCERPVALAGGGSPAVVRTPLGYSYRPAPSEWRRVRRLAGSRGRFFWRVRGEDGSGNRFLSAVRALRIAPPVP